MQFTIERRMQVGFGVVFALTALISYYSINSLHEANRLSQYIDAVQNANRALERARDLAGAMQRLEEGFLARTSQDADYPGQFVTKAAVPLLAELDRWVAEATVLTGSDPALLAASSRYAELADEIYKSPSRKTESQLRLSLGSPEYRSQWETLTRALNASQATRYRTLAVERELVESYQATAGKVSMLLRLAYLAILFLVYVGVRKGLKEIQRVQDLQRQAEARTRAIFEVANDGIVTLDSNLFVVAINPAAQRVFEVVESEVVGKPFSILVSSPVGMETEGSNGDALDPGIEPPPLLSGEATGRTRSGQMFPVDLSVGSDNDGGFVVVLRDTSTQKALEAELRLFETVARESTSGIVITDGQERLQYVNPAFEQISGYELVEIVGQRPGDILQGPETSGDTRRVLRDAIQSLKPVSVEILNYSKSQRPYWIELFITPILNEAGEPLHFMAVENDVTRRVLAEQSLRRTNALQRAVLDGANYSIISTDLEGNIQSANRAARLLLCGGLDESLEGVDILSFYDAQEIGARKSDTQKTELMTIVGNLESAENEESEWQYISRHGTRRPMRIAVSPLADDDDNLVGYLFIGRDITSEVKTIQARERLKAIVEATPDFVGTASPDGGIVYKNRAFREAIDGAEQQDLVDPSILPFQPEWAQRITDLKAIPSAIEHGHWVGESAVIRADGNEIPVSMVMLAHKDSADNLTHISIIGRDISDQKRNEKELLDARERLIRAQRVARMGSWEFDIESGRISWSDELFNILGVDDVNGEPDYQSHLLLYHPDDSARLQSAVDRAIREQTPYQLDVRLAQHNQGKPIWIGATGEPIVDSSGKTVRLIGTVIDITERKQAENDLQITQDRLETAQRIARLGSWEYDAVLETYYWSRELAAIFGNDTMGEASDVTSLEAMLHPDDVGAHSDAVFELIQTGHEYSLELRLKEIPDNPTKWIETHGRAICDEHGQTVRVIGTFLDITDRKTADQEFKLVSERLRLATSAAEIGIWDWDVKGDTLVWDDKMFKLYDVDRDEAEGKFETWKSRVHPDDQESTIEMIQDAFGGTREFDTEFRIVRSDGEIRRIQALGVVLRDESGRPERFLGMNWDVTRERIMQEQMERMVLESNQARADVEMLNEQLKALATTDGLTGLLNHRAFQDRLALEYERTMRQNTPTSVILMDVDKFKLYNDSFGHPEGDRVLQTVASVLKTGSRATDSPCRYGGEEFVVVLSQTDREGALEAADRFRAAIASQDWQLRPVTASFGVATLYSGVVSVADLIAQADKALYHSKETGRNRVTHFAQIANVATGEDSKTD